MRPGQNNKQRMRSRNPGSNNRKGPNPLTRSYESNGPDVKVRGTAHHVGEKYLQLARDAQTSGDPVMAESYLQHAEHYFRIIATAHLQQLQSQEGYVRPEGEVLVDEADDDDLVGGLPDRFASPLERTPPPPPAYVPPPAYAQQANPYQGRQQTYADRNTQERNSYQDRQGQTRNNQQRSDQERGTQERGTQDRSTAEWQERAAAERMAAERASAERPPQDASPERSLEDRATYERANQERANQERQMAERQPPRQEEERPRYDQRPARQERFQPNRYAQERPNQNRDRDSRQDRPQQDRMQQDRMQQDRPQQEPYRQDRNQQRDNRQPREFRPRMASGEREPRGYAPEAVTEAPVLPSFITAPVRAIAPVEPVFEPVAIVAAHVPAAHIPASYAPAVPEAEAAAPVEKVRRRRVARPAFEEVAPLLPDAGSTEKPDSTE